MITKVSVFLKTRALLSTVTNISTSSGVVIFRVKVSCFVPIDGIELWLVY